MPPFSLSPIAKILLSAVVLFGLKWVFFDVKPSTPPGEIVHPGMLERITLGAPLIGQTLDTHRYPFLQSRINRDQDFKTYETNNDNISPPSKSSPQSSFKFSSSPRDLFTLDIQAGIKDFWQRFQKPFATSKETIHLDEQVVKGSIDELLTFHGWASAACSSLMRPFGKSKTAGGGLSGGIGGLGGGIGGGGGLEDEYLELTRGGQLYYFALVVHTADHFLVDQLAVIVQLSKKLGPTNMFVSLVDYSSSDSVPFLCDLTEAVLIMLGISFRIKRVDSMTSDSSASYYPLEESFTRNLALEPLIELNERRHIKFSKVIWLKGFTCPLDILETLKIGYFNKALMVCGMDWKEHNSFFIFNDRWRTRDIQGNLFRGSKSTSINDEIPPKDSISSNRYSNHLPFQSFCCESGTHIVDPNQSYYRGIRYRPSSLNDSLINDSTIFNISAVSSTTNGFKTPNWSEGPCMDSSQMHFCRDLWLMSARDGVYDEARRVLAKDPNALSSPPSSSSSGEGADNKDSHSHHRLVGSDGRRIGKEMEQVMKEVVKSFDPKTANFEKKDWENSGDYHEDNDEDDGHILTQHQHGTTLNSPDKVNDDGNQHPHPPPLPDQNQAQAVPEPADVLNIEDGVHDRPGAPAAEEDVKGEVADALAAEQAAVAAGGHHHRDQGGGIEPEIGAGVQDGGDRGQVFQKRDELQTEEELSQEHEFHPLGHDLSSSSSHQHLRREILPSSNNNRNRHRLSNKDFQPAKILINPRCVTTYAGVSHTQLALDLFGSGDDVEPTKEEGGRYVLDEWRGAPDAFVCQEMRTTGGRVAPKQQRRAGFSIAQILKQGWRPT